MILNKEGAKEKWCPFSRISHQERPSGNRSGSGGMMAGSTCIADQCMMWIWLGDSSLDGYCGIASVPKTLLNAISD